MGLLKSNLYIYIQLVYLITFLFDYAMPHITIYGVARDVTFIVKGFELGDPSSSPK